MGVRKKTQYPRVYEILAGPFEGRNGSWYVVRDEADNHILLKPQALLDKLADA